MNSSGLKWSVFTRGHERGRRTCEGVTGRGVCVAEGQWVAPVDKLLHHWQNIDSGGSRAATRCLLLGSEKSILHNC